MGSKKISDFITKYTFGSMEINGVVYSKDLFLLNKDIKTNWRRLEGHNLCIEDLKDIIEYNPEILIIGTGFYGKMDVPKDTINKLNFKTITLPSQEAVNKFNQELKKGMKIAAGFHLTC